MAGYPDTKLKEFAKLWLNDNLPADLMADLADIIEDEDYGAEQQAHHTRRVERRAGCE